MTKSFILLFALTIIMGIIIYVNLKETVTATIKEVTDVQVKEAGFTDSELNDAFKRVDYNSYEGEDS